MIRNKGILFLSASCFSILGDTLLVFAVPLGLGLATKDVRAAVMMWLIPAVAIYLSSFLSRRVGLRKNKARKDYAKLLIWLGLVELLIAGLSFMISGTVETVVLVSAFVFIYALAKEGVPRLLYTVSVYRYFVGDEEYSKLAGANAALGLAAGLVGTLLAAALIDTSLWKVALVIDAISFLVFGYVILKYGRDVVPVEAESHTTAARAWALSSSDKAILFAVPLIFGLNALVWNYLPLIASQIGVGNVTSSIAMIAFLRLPGMMSGFRISQIGQYISHRQIVIALPLLTLVATLGFIFHPSIALIGCLIIVQGLVAGLYWPAGYTLRSKMNSEFLVPFNTMVVRRFALVQFIACLIALYVYRPGADSLKLLPIGILIVVSLAIFSAYPPRLLKIATGAIFVLAIGIFAACS